MVSDYRLQKRSPFYKMPDIESGSPHANGSYRPSGHEILHKQGVNFHTSDC